MFKSIKKHLCDHTGDEYMEKLIVTLMAFVIGAILVSLMNTLLLPDSTFSQGLSQSIQNIFSW